VPNTWTMKCRGLRMMPPSALLVASLAGCSIVHLSGDPGDTPPLRQAVDAAAETAVGVATDSKRASTQNAWRDAGGIWHWTQVKQSGGTFRCEGPTLGMPTQCDRTGP
jgi:hypothetical protein